MGERAPRSPSPNTPQLFCPVAECWFPQRVCIMRHYGALRTKNHATQKCVYCPAILEIVPKLPTMEIPHVLRVIYPQWISAVNLRKRIKEDKSFTEDWLNTLEQAGIVTHELVYNVSGNASTVYRLTKDPQK